MQSIVPSYQLLLFSSHMRIKFLIVLVGFIFLFSACSPTASITPIASLVPIKVAVSPNLAGWLPKINQCAGKLQSSALIIDEPGSSTLTQMDTDLSLQLGEKPQDSDYVSVPAFEEVVILQNASNPAEEISKDELTGILNGAYKTWGEVPSLASLPGMQGLPVVLFNLGAEDELTRWAEQAFLNGMPFRSDAKIVYSTEELSRSIPKTPGSIGFILHPNLPAENTLLSVKDANSSATAWKVPIVAITQTEPSGDLRTLLLCLQSLPTD